MERELSILLIIILIFTIFFMITDLDFFLNLNKNVKNAFENVYIYIDILKHDQDSKAHYTLFKKYYLLIP